MDYIQNRLLEISRLKTRYKLDLNGLICRRKQALDLLKEKPNCHLKELEDQELLLSEELNQHNSKLTKLRKQFASQLEKKLVKYLKPLGLENIQFKVAFSASNASERGADSIDFLFTANEGQPLAPLAHVASGGELSRFLLALTTVFASVSGSKTLIFDEIDVGVSGEISSSIGKLLQSLSLNTQVFCITHQPLLAALGDHHFSVSKKVCDGMTVSKVVLLKDVGDRQSELVKLTGGDFENASVYAASLLDNKAA